MLFQDPAYQEYYEQYYAELEKNSQGPHHKQQQQDLTKKTSKTSQDQKVRKEHFSQIQLGFGNYSLEN